MDDQQTGELAEKLQALMGSGTEAEVKQFIISHFKEFPEETQRELAVALFSDAMEEDFAQRSALAELKKKAVETIGLIEESEKAEG